MLKLDPIKFDVAQRLHWNYMSKPGAGGELVEAVVIDLKEAFEGILGTVKSIDSLETFVEVDFDTLICYFARYDDEDDVDVDKRNRNTVVIQLAKSANGRVTTITEQLYNFGGLKPPQDNIDGEQLRWPPDKSENATSELK